VQQPADAGDRIVNGDAQTTPQSVRNQHVIFVPRNPHVGYAYDVFH
jgi:hypothetical protein